MIAVHVYQSFEAIQSGRAGISEVADERRVEAEYLYKEKQMFCRKDSVIRRYQFWPGHDASDDNEIIPHKSGDWRGKFMIPYQMSDACRRIYDTIVMVNGLPYLVIGITNRKGMSLVLQDHVEKTYVITLKNLPDLRSPMPGYIPNEGKAYFLHRNPTNHNKQGMSHENSFLIEAGHASDRVAACGEQQALVGLLHRTTKICKVVKPGYISPKLAIFEKRGHPNLEYMGRCIGEFEGDKLMILRDEDKRNPWIAAAIKEVGLEN